MSESAATYEPAETPELSRTARALRGSAVAAVGTAVPTNSVPNAPIAARLGVTEEWITARTGVSERRIAPEGTPLHAYAAEAARRALGAARIEAGQVDLILVATISHEQLTPHAAALVAAEIGSDRAGAIDVNSACSGFVSALAIATSQIESRRADAVLVIGADLMSRLTDAHDRSTAALFGDGAGAVLVIAAEALGRVGPVVLGTDGARGALITVDREEGLIRMKGHDTFRQAVERLSAATVDAASAAGRELAEIDVFDYHQANARILTAVAERLGLDPARVVRCIDRYGNTSAASIPLALGEAAEQGLLSAGSTALLAAFGGGLTWAATVLEWGEDDDA